MNTLKTLGLAAVLGAALGATDADARHWNRYDRPHRGISIVIGQPSFDRYYRTDCYPGYYPQPMPYGYGQPYPIYAPRQRTRLVIPLGRDVRLEFNDVRPGRHCPPGSMGSYGYPYDY